jgi:UDP-N-acetylmuramoyl-tripeptide--D-alanyl-D-alanine ligase
MNAPETLLWESDALLAATRGRPIGKLPEGITGISIDTRTLQPGEAFFAIKGDKFDGHDFVSSAMKAGAALAVIAEEKLVALGGLSIPLLVVRDVLEAMRQLGMAARARTKARIIAVTGSVGKTTTKEMLRTVLAASGSVHASAASFNNHWGVPLTLARMPAETRFGVFEIGMNHPDEIRPLVKMVRPHIAAVMNVAAAHLGAFKNLDAIAHAKAEIFEGVEKGGHGLINGDDKRAKLLSRLCEEAKVENIVTFGTKKGADFRLKKLEEGPGHSTFTVVIERKDHECVLNLPGRHLVMNAVAVLGMANLAGADMAKSVEAISAIRAEKGRGARHQLLKERGRFILVDDSYNANPASMEAAIATLGKEKVGSRGRRIAVLGDMLELGETSEKLHLQLASPLVEAGIDLVFTVGQEIEALGGELPPRKHAGHFADWKEAADQVVKSLRGGDVIMLKASNGLRFGEFVKYLCEKFAVSDTTKRTGK